MPGYVRVTLYSFQHDKPKRLQYSPYPWTQPIYGKKSGASRKASARELDESNQKRLQKIVGKFLYYARAIDPTMFVALNSLTELQSKPSIKTAKK